jgi:hypothetical protein
MLSRSPGAGSKFFNAARIPDPKASVSASPLLAAAKVKALENLWKDLSDRAHTAIPAAPVSAQKLESAKMVMYFI